MSVAIYRVSAHSVIDFFFGGGGSELPLPKKRICIPPVIGLSKNQCLPMLKTLDCSFWLDFHQQTDPIDFKHLLFSTNFFMGSYSLTNYLSKYLVNLEILLCSTRNHLGMPDLKAEIYMINKSQVLVQSIGGIVCFFILTLPVISDKIYSHQHFKLTSNNFRC